MSRSGVIQTALTEVQLNLLLGALLAYRFVPFHRASRRVLSEDEVEVSERLWERLLETRNPIYGQGTLAPFAVEFRRHELALLVELLETCLREFRDDGTDLRIHLSADSVAEVEVVFGALTDALRAADGPGSFA